MARIFQDDSRDLQDPTAGSTRAARAMAFEQLGETHSIRHAALQQLRARICEVPWRVHDDLFLLAFLRQAKFDISLAHSRYNAYRDFVQQHPWASFESESELEDVLAILKRQPFALLRGKDVFGRSVIVINSANVMSLLKERPLIDLIQAAFFFVEATLADTETQIFGVTLCEDLSGYGLSVFRHIRTSDAALYVKMLQDIFAFRLQQLIIVHQPVFLRALHALATPFISTKLRKRIFVATTLEELHARVPRDVLPRNFGGNLHPAQTQILDVRTRITNTYFEAVCPVT